MITGSAALLLPSSSHYHFKFMLSDADPTVSEPGTGYQGPVVLFKRWITLSSESISTQYITQSVFLILSTAGQCFTHWIVLFI